MTSEENKIKAMERSKMNCEDPKLAKEEITQAMAASRKIRPNLISTGGDNEDGAASLVDNRNPPDMISYLLKPEDIPSAVFPARYELEATFTPENADEEFPTTLPELAKSIYQHYEWRRLFPANRAKYALPKTAESSFITVFKTREQAEGEIRIFGADRGDDEGAWFIYQLSMEAVKKPMVLEGIEIGALKVAESRGVVVLKRYADGLRTESPPKIVEQADDKKAKRAKETVVMREILAHTPTAASRPDRVQQYLPDAAEDVSTTYWERLKLIEDGLKELEDTEARTHRVKRPKRTHHPQR
ncbi:hypothetical protein M7I_6953 [Glarea lozoyensis 74030]|uniref:Uncharacterized protein n=1 Tax=Glarea lozoyensis (strain ATCC 74030 / MF5533) TaxID=1104152 RepID=H0EVZ5_GLAL7|nr:hypothetical protein M7I_6953 [Glarea lozoyensis 74030]